MHSFSCIPQIFVPYLPKWSKPRYFKAEALQVPQKVSTVLVWYFLLGTHISVYSCTGCGTSKFICFSEITGHYFPRRVYNPKLRAHPERVVLFCFQKIWFLGKQKFDVKQLKMKKFIKSIWQLIISTSNATLEIPSLHLFSRTPILNITKSNNFLINT